MIRECNRSILLLLALAIGGCATGKTPPAKTKMVRIETSDLLTFTFGVTEYCEEGEELAEATYCGGKNQSTLTSTLNNANVHPPSLPTVQVKLDPFAIDEHEVTNFQYLHCVEVGNCTEPKFGNAGSYTKYYNNAKYNNFPVVNVTWQQAQSYCKEQGKRLPTEYEWELVATKANGVVAPWGDSLTDCDGKSVAIKGCDIKNFTEDMYGPRRVTTSTDDVVDFDGHVVFDMGGNVSEWVDDIYHRFQTCKDEITGNTCEPSKHPDCHSMCPDDANVDVCNAYANADEPLVNPLSKETGSGELCLRGGSFAHVADPPNDKVNFAHLCHARPTDRSQKDAIDASRTYLGFRCAKDL